MEFIYQRNIWDFLLVNGLGLTETEIKSMMSFTRGSIHVKDVKEWVRKFEMKLQSKDVGIEKRTSVAGSKANAAMYVQPEDDESYIDEEVHAIEEALQELQGDDGEIVEHDFGEDDTALDEAEAQEILSTMLHTKKKTFAQSYKLKKARELARGYGSWKGKGSGNVSMNFKGKFKGDLTLEELRPIADAEHANKWVIGTKIHSAPKIVAKVEPLHQHRGRSTTSRNCRATNSRKPFSAVYWMFRRTRRTSRSTTSQRSTSSPALLRLELWEALT